MKGLASPSQQRCIMSGSSPGATLGWVHPGGLTHKTSFARSAAATSTVSAFGRGQGPPRLRRQQGRVRRRPEDLVQERRGLVAIGLSFSGDGGSGDGVGADLCQEGRRRRRRRPCSGHRSVERRRVTGPTLRSEAAGTSV
ncbi:unnamed protein product, partial [Scytosiphon promiscuus]